MAGKPGRSGRKPVEFKARCAHLTDTVVLAKVERYVRAKNPGDAGFRWAADWLRDIGYGKPTQVLEHTGGDAPVRFTLKIGDGDRSA